MISINKINHIIQLSISREKNYKLGLTDQYNKVEKELEDYLNTLTFDEVKSLQAIMYLGRDKDFDSNLSPQEIYDSQYEYFDKLLGWKTKSIEINQILEKLPLGAYLINAKQILNL